MDGIRRIQSAALGLAIFCCCTLPAAAAPVAPGSSEPTLGTRRTAVRALHRDLSIQWLPDVAERLRVLEKLIEDAPTATPEMPSTRLRNDDTERTKP
jgi:hypothetical protein